MQTGAVSIVVADDDRAIANLLCEILGDEGYHVICCSSGQEAWRALQEHKPAAAILDMQMETRTSGFEVVQLLRSDASMRHILSFFILLIVASCNRCASNCSRITVNYWQNRFICKTY